MTKEKLYESRDRIMDSFDFEKVLAHMERVDWKWSRGNEYGIPTIFELRGTARQCLSQVIESEEPSSNVSTGGFTALKFPWGLQLIFSVESRTSF